MNEAMKKFTQYLDQEEVKYTVSNDHVVRISFHCDNIDSITVTFIFDEDCKSVDIKVWSICKVTADKLPTAYAACNGINDRFRWVKFYVDKDNEVAASADAVIQLVSCHTECYELLNRTVNIVDEAYPSLMKALWA